jgi:hypothetical protein
MDVSAYIVSGFTSGLIIGFKVFFVSLVATECIKYIKNVV